MDPDLVARARSGDHQAFTHIVAAVAPRFHGVAYAILRDRTLAEDAAQAALVSVWRDLPHLRDAQHFDAWSTRVLVNACYGEGRRARWRGVEFTHSATPITTARDELHLVDDRDQLAHGFGQLSLEHRAVLVTHYFMDLPSDQAAEALGIPVGTYKSRLHRATAAMRAALDADARPVADDRSLEMAR